MDWFINISGQGVMVEDSGSRPSFVPTLVSGLQAVGLSRAMQVLHKQGQYS